MTIEEDRDEAFVAVDDVDRGESVSRVGNEGDGFGASSGAWMTVGPVMITTSSVVRPTKHETKDS